ncbi:MAG: serine hydrolase domain-containing protein [Aristaeellaceae bacterium]
MPDGDFVFATPESLGIPSGAVLDMLEWIRAHSIPLHSLIILRHGKVAAEGYCPPFDRERKHRMYSVSKSITAVAVGMLISEGRLSLDSRVADFFPEYITGDVTPYALKATVRHLLMMATFNECNAYTWTDSDFVRVFFQNDYPKQMPGTVFHYDTNGTVVLCAIVEKITGMKLLDYMRPLLDELGISPDAWCLETPEGRSWTGSGILFTPRDLARFALFCLHRGEWNGRQLVDRDFMMQATTRQINNYVAEWSLARCGYGYQFWMVKDGFACCGMGGQLAFMYPEKDTVIVFTADTQHINAGDDFLRMYVERLMEQLSDSPLPENPAMQEKLARALELTMPLVPGSLASPTADRVSGVRYVFDENRWGFDWMRLTFGEDCVSVTFRKRGEVLTIPLYLGRFGEFAFPEKFAGRRISVWDTNYRCISSAAWDSAHTLIGEVFSVDDYLGSIRMQFTFVEDTLTVFMTAAAENFFQDYRGYLAGRAARD